ncbi:hypothetical protein QBC40DRAFT_309960 [Triangularia verruculosa]|uniref:Uncharacterized protein n=1 Tax=Triangularia verruculosa TaxID=2587418 RepID=A0AAN7APH0_9PEZI|nr:hypothetical protein QBC40DRAFT_309960 [Triangularia verruculosa]
MRTTRSLSKKLEQSLSISSEEAATLSKSSPPKTDDGHYIIVNGRKWRATDPITRKPEWWNDTAEGRKKRWEGALTKLRQLHSEPST